MKLTCFDKHFSIEGHREKVYFLILVSVIKKKKKCKTLYFFIVIVFQRIDMILLFFGDFMLCFFLNNGVLKMYLNITFVQSKFDLLRKQWLIDNININAMTLR